MNYNLMILVATKLVGQKKLPPPPPTFGAVVGSEIWDPGWIKINIPDPLHYWKD